MPSLAAVTVPAPPRQPHKYGLFSAVPLHEVTDPHQLLGIQWEPDTCARPKVLPNDCPCPTAKEFTPPAPVQNADPFSVMGSWQCALAGYTPEQAQDRALTNLTTGEQQAVEWAIWTGLADLYPAGDVGDDQRYHGPRFAHPSTPVLGEVACAKDALALIEQYTATHYTGQPLVHLPRPVLPYFAAENLLSTTGTRLETVYGTPLVAGAGYGEANTGPDGTVAPQGSWWIYVTGAMQIYRSDVFTPPDATVGFSRCNNEFVALAERTYLVGWDCLTAAVLITPCCECGPTTGVTP